MSVMTVNFPSRYLHSNQTISVILPDRPLDADPRPFYATTRRLRVLWLLHGTFGDHTDWIRRTNIETYATEAGVAVIMPSALNSNYSDWPGFSLGFDANRFLVDELLPLAHSWLPVSAAREDNVIAGLSMGGRGALKFAVNNPDLFSAAAILSAAPVELDALDENAVRESDHPFLRRLWGMAENAGGWARFRDSDENVWRLMNDRRHDLPRLLFASGEEDELVRDDLRRFRAHAEATGIPATFFEIPNLGHEWRFWDQAIERALPFLFGNADD